MRNGFCFMTLTLIVMIAAGVCVAQEPERSAPAGTVLTDLQNQVIDTLKVWVPEVVARDSIPGAAIVIVNRDDILWIGTFGHTDTSKTKAVTDKTLFSIQITLTSNQYCNPLTVPK